MGATLQASFNQAKRAEPICGQGVYLSDFVDDLRKKFGAGGTLHRHDGISGDGGTVLYSTLATPPTGMTGGTTHNKTAHRKIAGRVRQLPLSLWKMASGTVLGAVSSVTLPYFSTASGVHKITWPATATIKLLQELVIPDNYSTTVKTQNLAIFARAKAASTTVTFKGSFRHVQTAVAIPAAKALSTKILTAGATAPRKFTNVMTYATFAKVDVVAIQIYPTGNSAGADTELFASMFEYTAEE